MCKCVPCFRLGSAKQICECILVYIYVYVCICAHKIYLLSKFQVYNSLVNYIYIIYNKSPELTNLAQMKLYTL